MLPPPTREEKIKLVKIEIALAPTNKEKLRIVNEFLDEKLTDEEQQYYEDLGAEIDKTFEDFDKLNEVEAVLDGKKYENSRNFYTVDHEKVTIKISR